MEATLTGWILVAAWLVSFVASRLVDWNSKIFQVFVASGLSTHWRRCCKIASKVCPCTTFCQQKPFCQRHGVGPLLAAPNKDQTSWKTVAPKWQTFCMLCIFCYRNMQRWIANFEASLECRMCSMQSYAQLGIHLLVHLVLANLQEGPKKIQPVEEMGPWNLRCLQSIRAWWLADGSFVHVNIPQTCSNDQEVHKYIPGFQVHSAFACNLYCLVFDLSSVWDEEFAFHSLIFCWKRVQLIESERYFLFWTVSFCNPCRNDRLREMRHHTAIISHWIPSFQRQLYVYLLLRFYFAPI